MDFHPSSKPHNIGITFIHNFHYEPRSKSNFFSNRLSLTKKKKLTLPSPTIFKIRRFILKTKPNWTNKQLSLT